MKNLNAKKQILAIAKLLRNVKNEKFRKVYVIPDLSYQERLKQKSLRAELHRRRNAGKTNLIIHKSQIITVQSNVNLAGMETEHSPPTDAYNNNR